MTKLTKPVSHYDQPHVCETGGAAVGSSEWLGVVVTYISITTERQWDAVITSTHENHYNDDPKANQLPLACLEFRNERGKIVRKHRVLPWGWAYWCQPPGNGIRGVWKPKDTLT